MSEERSQAGSDSDPGYVLDDQIGYLMRLATQRHTAIFQDRMSDGLTPTQFALLNRLAEVGPSSQNHLGRLAALDVATVKGVVDRLAAKGYVTLAPDPSDGRLRIVSLSPAGEALIPELHRCGRAITAETLKPLTSRERDTVIRLLRKLA
ncbi:MarR family winged helix-turn-helix transcriptional regulator [Acuticoccus yangtzensis]|uniref:MarR family winged helix-turn-helix transcriptional regulator n=1 Tax=Acuticoccus yangtzensis TaxID=1443441 RepID=UPI0009499702|nr:MarR family transcriptional regulator [Acuticoccus yangtzensis]